MAPVTVAVAVAVAAVAVAGCGGSASGAGVSTPGRSPAAMRLERADLALVAHGLRDAEDSIEREVAASRAAWPAVVRGLPRAISARTRRRIATARSATELLATPHFISYAGELTSAAAQLAGLLLSYEGLSGQGWTMTAAAAGHLPGGAGLAPPSSPQASPAASDFLRVNAALYIGCVYDGHYNLSVIGDGLKRAYAALGGAAAFGATLRQAEVEALARRYSPEMARLAPRPPPSPAGS